MLKCMTNLSRQRMRPSPSRLSSGVRHALGFGMLETLLTLAGLTVFSVVAFASYQHVSAKAKVSDESENLRELVSRFTVSGANAYRSAPQTLSASLTSVARTMRTAAPSAPAAAPRAAVKRAISVGSAAVADDWQEF